MVVYNMIHKQTGVFYRYYNTYMLQNCCFFNPIYFLKKNDFVQQFCHNFVQYCHEELQLKKCSLRSPPWFYLLLQHALGNKRRFLKVGGSMTNQLENVRKRRTKILVKLAANQMNEQPLENRFVPQDQDLGQWSSYLKKRLKKI